MEKKNALTNVFMVIMGVLAAVMLVIVAITFADNPFTNILCICALLFTCVYAFGLYKMPHSNMLKAAMILFVLTYATTGVSNAYADVPIYETLIIEFSSLGVIYCVGRLNRIDKNKIIFIAVEAALVLSWVLRVCTGSADQSQPVLYAVKYARFLVMYSTLIISYFTRFNAHIEAGINVPKTE